MKSLKITLFAILGLSLTSQAQSWTELEVNAGTYLVQGEMQITEVGVNNINPVLSVSLHTRAHKSNSFAFGGSISSFTMQGDFNDNSKEWLSGHEVSGMGFNAQASIRYIMTGRDDMRFMKGAFLTYIEGAAGAQMISFQTTYPPATGDNLSNSTLVRLTEVTPIATATLGMQYYIDYNWGVNMRLSGSATGSDQLDGVVGVTDTKDYIWMATVGVSYAF